MSKSNSQVVANDTLRRLATRATASGLLQDKADKACRNLDNERRLGVKQLNRQATI